MSNRLTAPVRAAIEAGGGVVEVAHVPDLGALERASASSGALVGILAGPRTKAEVIGQLRGTLPLPAWIGATWDALEEVLAHPEEPLAGPIIIVWMRPSQLQPVAATTLEAILRSASSARRATGSGPLVVVIHRQPPPEVAAMSSIPSRIQGLGKVHHVALIVASIEVACRVWRDLLGAPLEAILDIESDRVRIAFLTVGESKIELVQPTDDATGVARFLATKGEGFHHVCLEVGDLAQTLDRLAAEGLELIDRVPRRGAEGPVAFIHPRSCHGVLVELIEAPGGPAWGRLGFGPSDRQAEKGSSLSR